MHSYGQIPFSVLIRHACVCCFLCPRPTKRNLGTFSRFLFLTQFYSVRHISAISSCTGHAFILIFSFVGTVCDTWVHISTKTTWLCSLKHAHMHTYSFVQFLESTFLCARHVCTIFRIKCTTHTFWFRIYNTLFHSSFWSLSTLILHLISRFTSVSCHPRVTSSSWKSYNRVHLPHDFAF